MDDPATIAAVALAIGREVEGDGFDPFADPEAYEFAEKLARAALSAIQHLQGTRHD